MRSVMSYTMRPTSSDESGRWDGKRGRRLQTSGSDAGASPSMRVDWERMARGIARPSAGGMGIGAAWTRPSKRGAPVTALGPALPWHSTVEKKQKKNMGSPVALRPVGGGLVLLP